MSKSEDKERNTPDENVIRIGAGFVAKERPETGQRESSINSSPGGQNRETGMTHITEARVIGNHADMSGSAPAAAHTHLKVKDAPRAAARRRVRRRELAAAQSTWDSEGGAIREDGSPPNRRGGRAPRGLGR